MNTALAIARHSTYLLMFFRTHAQIAVKIFIPRELLLMTMGEARLQTGGARIVPMCRGESDVARAHRHIPERPGPSGNFPDATMSQLGK